jgi:branched-chain amino acid transport system ATP-binding protein
VLELKNVEVMYNDSVLVLKGLSLDVKEGQIAALLGPNGAGKSTALNAVSGLLKADDGMVTDGEIRFCGERIDRASGEDIVRMGLFQVMEGRRVFEDLTVDENLAMGAYTRRDRDGVRRDREMIFAYFPRLQESRRRLAGYLSGGEQQMLAISRALMARPRLITMDEPSLGLAPQLIDELFAIIKRINGESRTTILLVEQNARIALGIADHGYVMENGRVVLDGDAGKLQANEDIRHFYLGGSPDGSAKRHQNLKSYKRRKRWLS